MSVEEKIIAVARFQAKCQWYKSLREYWMLDCVSWERSYKWFWEKSEPISPEYRFGLPVVNEHNAEHFLEKMQQFHVDWRLLGQEFHAILEMTTDWWEVEHLMPMVFVDFDSRKLHTCYPEPYGFENHVPRGWTGQYSDFRVELPESVFPISQRFWFDNGRNLLDGLEA